MHYCTNRGRLPAELVLDAASLSVEAMRDAVLERFAAWLG